MCAKTACAETMQSGWSWSWSSSGACCTKLQALCPSLAGRMDQILKKRMCWVHMVPGKQFIPVLLAVNQLCYSCESTLCNESTKPGQLRSKHASGLLTQLRQSSCVVTFISLVIFHSLSLLRPCSRGFLCACLIPNPHWLRLASSQQAFW